MTTPDPDRWPEFHLAKYANQVVLGLAAYSLYAWFNDDVGRLGFNSYSAFAISMAFAVSGNGLTLFVVSRRGRSRLWKTAVALTISVLVLSAVGLYALEQAHFPWRQFFGWSVVFVFLTHLLNLFTFYRVARFRLGDA